MSIALPQVTSDLARPRSDCRTDSGGAHLRGVPTPTDTPERLRQRATALRRTASILDTSPLRQTRLYSGADTWIGPSANRFDEELRRSVSELDGVSHDLNSAARQLELRAVALESAARAASLAGGPR